MFFCGFGAMFFLLGLIAWFATHRLEAVVFTCIPSVGFGLACAVAVWLEARKIDAELSKEKDNSKETSH